MHVLHVEIELEMTWIASIKRLEVSDMTWLLVEDNVDVLHVEIKHIVRISFIRDINNSLYLLGLRSSTIEKENCRYNP